jgi:hypothetical protein
MRLGISQNRDLVYDKVKGGSFFEVLVLAVKFSISLDFLSFIVRFVLLQILPLLQISIYIGRNPFNSTKLQLKHC